MGNVEWFTKGLTAGRQALGAAQFGMLGEARLSVARDHQL